MLYISSRRRGPKLESEKQPAAEDLPPCCCRRRRRTKIAHTKTYTEIERAAERILQLKTTPKIQASSQATTEPKPLVNTNMQAGTQSGDVAANPAPAPVKSFIFAGKAFPNEALPMKRFNQHMLLCIALYFLAIAQICLYIYDLGFG